MDSRISRPPVPAPAEHRTAEQRWADLKAYLDDLAARCESAADEGDGNEDLEDVVADYRTEARALRTALAKMAELEAGR